MILRKATFINKGDIIVFTHDRYPNKKWDVIEKNEGLFSGVKLKLIPVDKNLSYGPTIELRSDDLVEIVME